MISIVLINQIEMELMIQRSYHLFSLKIPYIDDNGSQSESTKLGDFK